MRFRHFLFRIVLIGLIAASIGFTWIIWFNPAHMEHKATSEVTVKTTTSAVKHHETGVFLPTRIIETQAGTTRLLAESKGDLSARVRRNVKSGRVQHVGAASKLSNSAYAALLSRDNTVQMTYAGEMSWQLFDKLYFSKSARDKTNDFEFNRIIVNLRSGALTLANDRQRQTHKLQMSKKLNLVALNGALSHANLSYPFNYQRMGSREVALFQGDVKIPTYTYLLDKQNANHYVTALMGSGNRMSSAVDAKQLGEQTVYTVDNNNQRLAVDRNDSMMQYENFVVSGPKQTDSAVLRAAYDDMMRLNVNEVDDMSYFGYQHDSSTVTFRTYVGGLPIINDMLNGTVTVTHTSNSKRIAFSGDNLAVAIPTSETDTTLPAAQTVLDQLRNYGLDTSSVSDVQLGYDWNKDETSTQVADLAPTYYIQVNGDYYDYKDVLNGTVKLTANGTRAQTADNN